MMYSVCIILVTLSLGAGPGHPAGLVGKTDSWCLVHCVVGSSAAQQVPGRQGAHHWRIGYNDSVLFKIALFPGTLCTHIFCEVRLCRKCKKKRRKKKKKEKKKRNLNLELILSFNRIEHKAEM